MSTKYLSVLLLLLAISCSALAVRRNTTIYSDPMLNLLFNPPRPRCGSVACALPCHGAAPPRVCPEPAPECQTGCACVVDCRRNAVTCFETKDCAERKKLFRRTKKPKL